MNTPVAFPANARFVGLPQDAVRSAAMAQCALDCGRVDEAAQHLRPLLIQHPDHPEVLRLIGGIYMLRGDHARAVAIQRRATAFRPNDALCLNALGASLTEAGDYDEAIAVLQQACALDSYLAVAWFNLALAQIRSVKHTEAASSLQRALSLAPDDADIHCMLAEQLKASGQIKGAIAEYRRILSKHPHAGMAWWGLADIKTVRLDQADILRIRRALDHSQEVSVDDRIAMGFALAKALDDDGRCAESLTTLSHTHSLARTLLHWDAAAHSIMVDTVLSLFNPPPVSAEGALGSEVIFITGLPRSGSSLIEQILASHSQVEGAGELPDLPSVLTEESRRRNLSIAHWVRTMNPSDWQKLGQCYLQRTSRWRKHRPYFTDKLPGNWLYVGAIRAMLPGARVLICRRDPLETCLSCYRQRLSNNEYSRDFVDLASYWHDFDRAARHWSRLHTRNVRENSYESLLADPEAHVRELLSFCGLEFEQACLEFHLNNRAVHTPSAAQVREPLQTSTARAHRYGALLDPLREALGVPPFSPDMDR